MGSIAPAGGSAGSELTLPLRTFSGARAHRAVHTGRMRLEEHAHDWPCLALHLLGRYRETNESGEAQIGGPAAVLHPAGSAHMEEFADGGAEVVIIHFDPAWLPLPPGALHVDRARIWSGGSLATQARALAAYWQEGAAGEMDLAAATSAFLARAVAGVRSPARPPWLQEALAAPLSAPRLAAALGLHRAWVARSYRAAVGEGLRETLRRRRVEDAVSRLRGTAQSLAEVALASGFCDQSHMNRAVVALTGRTPGQIRAEGSGLH